jgi:hypothetical protein
MARRLSRRSRGTATVELALLMLVLLPTIFYTLFLEDLLLYKLDLAESVFSTAWDFTNGDYMKNTGDDISGVVQTSARKTYGDHMSAWNSYDNESFDLDNNHTEHHVALTAHQCWLQTGAHQVTCSIDSMPASVTLSPLMSVFNHGGVTKCEAILGVENYFIPQKLFAQFSKADRNGTMVGNTLEKDWRTEGDTDTNGQIHTNAQAADGNKNSASNAFLFPQEFFGVLNDPWALNHVDDISPNIPSGNPIWVRTQVVYTSKDKTSKAAQWLSDVSDFVLATAGVDGTGDMVETAAVAYKSDKDREFNNAYASAWSDQRQQDSYSARTNDYFGMDTSTW